MTDNASLDEFADAVEREQAVDSADSPDSTDSGDSTDSADSPTEPARPTYICLTDETACQHCGDATTRRWRDGDALVCASCKDW